MREGNGVEVHHGDRVLHLDPKRAVGGSVVSHGHLDHLASGGVMTPPTVDMLRVRRGGTGTALAVGEEATVAGFPLRLQEAGHVLGAAMVEVEVDGRTLLYTGDFSTVPGLTRGGAKPVACDVLVMESTYGEPRWDLPPRDLVLENVERWVGNRLAEGPVALGAYALGRAQELVALANRNGWQPMLPPDVADLTRVYNDHGCDLTFVERGSGEAWRETTRGNLLHIVPRTELRKGTSFTKRLRKQGGSAALLSGWCHRFRYFDRYAIDAQFPLTDHASFPELVAFARACDPDRVLLHHGSAKRLARELKSRVGLQAEAL